MPVRGIACWYAEMALQAVFNSLDPAGDGSIVRAIRVAECAHCSNDCPKKFNPSDVIEFAARLLATAGLSRASPRS